MSRRVVITGLGPVSAIGLGIEPMWDACLAGQSAVSRIDAFNPSGFDCQVAGQIRDLDIRQFVPKSYRKATKVMARDIELAVTAADLAARDAALPTKGTVDTDNVKPYYPSGRVGANIGAGLIATDLDELTAALVVSQQEDGQFDLNDWGSNGMNHLTPLWLLKYLPNMPACHVTIVHECMGPSNTITCQEASSGLSIGEALRIIQRNDADASFCGGADSKVNPMAYLRQLMTGRYTTTANDNPTAAVRPFCHSANGSAVGEGGGIIILEALDAFNQRLADGGTQDKAPRIYAEVVGFGASQSVNLPERNLLPDDAGRGIAVAIRSALGEAGLSPADIDLIVPFGLGHVVSDDAEIAALRKVFGDRLKDIPLAPVKPYVGNCAAGSGALDICLAAKAVAEQMLPAVINCDTPKADLQCATRPPQKAVIRHALTYATGIGGQNAALILKRYEE